MLCRVNLLDVSKEDLEILKAFFFTPLDKIEERNGRIILNYMGGELCKGINDFGDTCKECRYQPEIVLKYLRRQGEIVIEGLQKYQKVSR